MGCGRCRSRGTKIENFRCAGLGRTADKSYYRRLQFLPFLNCCLFEFLNYVFVRVATWHWQTMFSLIRSVAHSSTGLVANPPYEWRNCDCFAFCWLQSAQDPLQPQLWALFNTTSQGANLVIIWSSNHLGLHSNPAECSPNRWECGPKQILGPANIIVVWSWNFRTMFHMRNGVEVGVWSWDTGLVAALSPTQPEQGRQKGY